MSILLAALASVLYGAGDFFGGLASRRAPVLAVTFVSQGVGLVALGLAMLVWHGAASRADLVWGLLAGISGTVGIVLLYRGLALGLVSVVAPTISLCAVVVPIAFGLLIGERPSALAIAGIGLAGVAIVLISAASGAPAASDTRVPLSPARMLPIALASGLAVGVFLVCLGRIAPGAGLAPLVVSRASSVGGLALLLAIRREPLSVPRAAVGLCLGTGVLDVTANVLYVIAAGHHPISLVATIVSLAPATTVLLARIVLQERLNAPQRYGLVLAGVAVIMITWR